MAIIRGPGEGEENHAFNIRRVFKVLPDETSAAFCAFEEDVPSGVGPPLHVHHREHELFAVISGRVLFRVNGRDVEAGPGWTVLIPPGTPHTFKGIDDSVCLVTLTPGQGGEFFRAVAEERLEPSRDMERITELALQSGLEFVGPPI